ncbi:hypothetical protein PR048_013366 [Dryococelus australis]|uniref:Uncharacterized protein n=1 Tax=Dryococelus australis TaxID=614101 RepID=A0ABQ9HSU0_9NEOP|nr:hypothetical protein PR048_013366 [Dryococelus australis]
MEDKLKKKLKAGYWHTRLQRIFFAIHIIPTTTHKSPAELLIQIHQCHVDQMIHHPANERILQQIYQCCGARSNCSSKINEHRLQVGFQKCQCSWKARAVVLRIASFPKASQDSIAAVAVSAADSDPPSLAVPKAV